MAQKGLLGRIGDAFKVLRGEGMNKAAQQALVTSSKSIGTNGGMRSGYSNYVHLSKFMQLLQSNNWSEIAPPPIVMRDLYRIMLWAIPELASALDMHCRVIGCPTVESKDAVFVNDFEQWAQEMPWKGEKSFAYDTMKGLAGYLYSLQSATLTSGQSFTTLMDSQGNMIQRPSQNIGFVRLHDSTRFNYMEVNIDQFQLTYEHGGTIEMDLPESPYRDTVRFINSTKFPEWGVPVLYGCERSITDAMLAQEAWKAHNRRVQDPSSVAVFGMEPPAGIAQDDTALVRDMREQWEARGVELTAAYAENFAKSANTGKGFQALEVTTGKITVAEHVFGKDIAPANTYRESVDPYIASALLGMYAVPDFFGIQTMAGGGIGSDQHTIMSQRSESFGVACRSHQDAHVKWLMSNFFMRNSKRIPEFQLKWMGLDVSNKKAEAEVKKIAAEAMKMNVETAQMIADGVGPAAANQWLKENLMGYKFPLSYNPNPEPVPPAK